MPIKAFAKIATPRLLTITACSQIRPEFPSSRDTQSNTVFSASKSGQIPQPGNLLRLNYEGFTVWLDCEKRGCWGRLRIAEKAFDRLLIAGQDN